MKKPFHLLQWAVLLALILFGLRVVFRPIPPPAYQPETWNSWSGFQALSYAGITREDHPDHVTPAHFAGQLAALKQAGFQTIFPEDALAFLEKQHPLPDRALLILVEGGRKDTYISATSALRKQGMVATMMVPTSLTRRWSSLYLHVRDLKIFARQAHWRIGSMGHCAIELTRNPTGENGPFLTQRLTVAGQIERDDAYRSRIMHDFEEARRILKKAGITSITAYLFPHENDGTSRKADPLAASAIAAALKAQHRVAFVRDDQAFNGPGSDPLHLTRLKVRGDWTPEYLLSALQAR